MGVIKDVANSLLTAVFGVVLLGVSLFVLGWNEKRSVWTAQTIGYARDEYVQLNSCIPDAQYNGKLIALEGCEATPTDTSGSPTNPVTTAEYLADLPIGTPTGNLALDNYIAFSWTRSSQQYVRHETEKDKEYTYTSRWQSSQETYKNPDKKFSPPAWPGYFQVTNVVAPQICVGPCQGQSTSFFLVTSSSWGKSEGSKIGRQVTLPLNTSFQAPMNDNFNGLTICNGYAQTTVANTGCIARAADGGSSRMLGDFRMQWDQKVKQRGDTVSVLAKQVQDGNGKITFMQWQNPHHSSCSYCRIGDFENGNMTGDEILDELESENKTLTWVLRFVGWLLCWMSFMMMCTPVMTVAENAAKLAHMIPCFPYLGWMADAVVEAVECIIGAITCVMATSLSMLVIGIAWLIYRPAIGIPLLCVCVAGCVGTWIVMNRLHAKHGKKHGETMPLSMPGETEV